MCFLSLRYERVDVQPDEWAAAPAAPQSMAPHQSNAHVALPIGGSGMPPAAGAAAPQQLPSMPPLLQHPLPHAHALPLCSALVADAYEYEVRPDVVWESARAIFSAHWSAYMALLLVGLLAAALVAGALGFALVRAANSRIDLDPQRPASSRSDSADAAATTVNGDERVWLLIGGSLVVRLAAQWVFHVSRCAALLVSLEHMRGRRQMTAWQSCHAVLQWPLLKPLTKVFLATTILEFIASYLFVLPAIYLYLAFSFATCIVLDRPHLSTRECLGLSRQMASKNLCGILSFHFAAALILLGGLVACFFGVFPAMCIVNIMTAVLYRDVFGLDASYLQQHTGGAVMVAVLDAPPELGPYAGRMMVAPYPPHAHMQPHAMPQQVQPQQGVGMVPMPMPIHHAMPVPHAQPLQFQYAPHPHVAVEMAAVPASSSAAAMPVPSAAVFLAQQRAQAQQQQQPPQLGRRLSAAASPLPYSR